jgi:hypothetical protein
MGKTQDPGSRARINNPDHTSQSPETILCAKIPKLSDADTGSEMEKIRIRDKYPWSASLHVHKIVTKHSEYGFGIQKPYKLTPDPEALFTTLLKTFEDCIGTGSELL